MDMAYRLIDKQRFSHMDMSWIVFIYQCHIDNSHLHILYSLIRCMIGLN